MTHMRERFYALARDALDEERRIRVGDRALPLERKARGDADHQLLADAEVVDARMLWQRARADLREHHLDALVVPQCLRHELVETLALAHVRTCATTQRGRSPRLGSSRASASWSRPSTDAESQPSSSKRAPIPPGQW